ncbi:MAG TPA: hypothetical protein VF190_02220 [Rhodothermales bacterium]
MPEYYVRCRLRSTFRIVVEVAAEEGERRLYKDVGWRWNVLGFVYHIHRRAVLFEVLGALGTSAEVRFEARPHLIVQTVFHEVGQELVYVPATEGWVAF